MVQGQQPVPAVRGAKELGQSEMEPQVARFARFLEFSCNPQRNVPQNIGTNQ